MRTANKSPPVSFLTALLLSAGLSGGCDPSQTSTGTAAMNPPGNPHNNSTAGAGQPSAKTVLRVGQPAPKFALKDQVGKERSLDEFLGKGAVALFFFRSAGW
jgi:hypothetical protein